MVETRPGSVRARSVLPPEPALFERLEGRWTPTTAMGPEFLVNTATANTQALDAPGAVAADASGNFLTVWESYDQDSLLSWGVYGQRFDAAGSALGSAFLVNATLLNDQRAPAAAMNASGAFVVAWEGRGLLSTLFPGIYVQRYNSSGVSQGTEIGVAGSLLISVDNVAVAMAADGSFVVAWEDASISARDISARMYDSSGSPLGAAFNVNVTTAGSQSRPQIAMDSAGNFLIVWGGNGSGDNAGVYARLYNAAGAAQTGEVLLNQTTAGTQSLPAVAADSTGEFVVAWSGRGTGDTGGVFARRVDATGAASGSEILVNQTTSGVQHNPSVAFDADDEYLVAWSGQGTGDTDGVFAREFWSGDTAKGAEFAASSTTAGTQANISAAGLGDNAYALAWSGNGSGDADGAFARAFENSAPVATTSGGTASYTENGSGTAVDPALTLSDSDSATLSSATITLTTNYLSTQDLLLFTDQLGITGSWSALTGILTLSGTASVANYQTALRTILYANSSESPSTLTRTVGFIINDGTDPSAAATRGVTVASVNDPPVVATSGGTASYTENGAGTAIDPGLTISDADTTTLVGATVTITGNYLSAQDLLLFADQLGITGSWSALTGILTLTGIATLASYQTALRTVLYANSSENPSTLARTIQFIINDGADPSAAATRGVTVAAVNDPPVVTTSGGTASYTENGAGTAIDPGLTTSDADTTTLSSATVTITGNYLSTQDVLLFTDQLGITGSWSALTGTLTLTGIATLASYQTALRSIRYANSSENPSTLTRTVEFIADDGADPSASATRNVTVAAVNDPPVVTTSGGSASYTENGAGTAVDPGLTTSDPDSTTLAGATITITGNYISAEDLLLFTDQLGITGSWSASTGTLTLSGIATLASYQTALRSIRYANSSENPSTLTRTVEFIADDGADPSASATRNVAVAAVNDPPVVTTSGGSASYTENGAGTAVDPGVTISDPDSTTLAGAIITITGNYLSTQDLLLFTDQLGITGSWSASTGTLTLSGIASLASYQTALRSIRYANSSEDPSTLTRTVEFIVDDGADPGAGATRGVTVAAVNDPPVITASGGAASYTENGPGTAVDPGLTTSDPDSTTLAGATITIAGNYLSTQDLLLFTDQLGITGSWSALTGTLTLSGVASLASYRTALRSIRYANSSENPSTLTRTIEFIVNDGADPSPGATRAVTVAAVNDPPIVTASGGSASYTENGPATAVDPGLTLSDPDSTSLAGAAVTISANYLSAQDLLLFTNQLGITGSWNALTGTLTLTGIATLASYQSALRSIVYINSSNNPSTLTRTIRFIINDGTDPSSPATRGLAIAAVSDPPVITTSGGSASYTESSPGTAIDPGLTLSDPDSTTLLSATITISANYLSTQDLLLFTDQLGITGSWNALTGTLTLSGIATLASYQTALRSVLYANSSNSPSTLPRTIRFIVNDGTDPSSPAARGIAITAVNDPPAVIPSGGPASYTENGPGVPVDPALTLSDPDSTLLTGATIRIISNYAPGLDALLFTDQSGITGLWDAITGTMHLSGSATIATYRAALRSIRFTTAGDDPSTLPRTIGFIVTDGLSPSAEAAAPVAVNSVNDAPVVLASPGTGAYTENDPGFAADAGLLLSDPDSPQLTGATVRIVANFTPGEDLLVFADRPGITGSWNSATGTLTLMGVASLASYQDALRSVLYRNTSDNPTAAPRTFRFTIDDGAAAGTPAERSVPITPVNDAPVLLITPGLAIVATSPGGIPVDPGLTLVEPDSPTLSGAVVRISGGYASREDALTLVTGPGITGSWNPATGILTLTGPASPAAYQAALRSVFYTNSSRDPRTALRTVTFEIGDGLATGSGTRMIAIPTEAPPIGTPLPPVIAPAPDPAPSPTRPPDGVFWYDPGPATPITGGPDVRETPSPSPYSLPIDPASPTTPAPPAPEAPITKAPEQPESDGSAIASVPPTPPTTPAPIPDAPGPTLPPPEFVSAAPVPLPEAPAASVYTAGAFSIASTSPRWERAAAAAAAGAVIVGVSEYTRRYLNERLLRAHLLMVLPVWRWFDPIPVLDSFDKTPNQRRIEHAVAEQCEDEARIRGLLDGPERRDG